MTTDSENTEQYLNFVLSRFLISVPGFVSHDYELTKFSCDNFFSSVMHDGMPYDPIQVIIRPATSLAQDRESSPVKDPRSTHCATPPT